MEVRVAESHNVGSELRLRQVIGHDHQPVGWTRSEAAPFSLPGDFEPALKE
jgi:hypothetical protein